MAERVNLPSGFGGLLRYNEEYESKLKITPAQVVTAIIGVILFVLILRILFPVA